VAKRSMRAQIARETLDILERGSYTPPSGEIVSIADELAKARSGSVVYSPRRFAGILRQRDLLLQRASRQLTAFEVANETTLHAARRLLESDPRLRVLALNFASAKNPGGGFLNGSQAQEESLARASGLYSCIAPLQQMYEANRRFPSCLYTDHMIYSPDVPVFRDDADGLLEKAYLVSFVTAPAVNAGAVARKERHNLARIEPVMKGRMERLLALAVVHGHDTLVLGAWGCGVFANNSSDVARWFAEHLLGDGRYRGAFRKVVFAVLDASPSRATIRPFQQLFGDVR
jgi:uncharacterized protein (TIGR02452 family)